MTLNSGSLENVLARSPEPFADNIFVNMFFDQTFAQDDAGNLFLAYARDGVGLTVSTDGGETWRDLGIVSPPQTTGGMLPSITARGTGEVALAWYGTTGGGAGPVFGFRERWHSSMTYSPDALADDPVFHSAPTSGPDVPAPLQNVTGCCASTKQFVEYTGVRFTGPQSIRATFAHFDGFHPEQWGQRMTERTLGRMELDRTPG